MLHPFRHRHRAREWIEIRRDPALGPPLSYGWVGKCKCGEIVERRPSPAAMNDLRAYEYVMTWKGQHADTESDDPAGNRI